jgi:hypothetical protein
MMLDRLQKWLRQQSKALKDLYCGFRRIDKAMGQVYQCWWRICWDITVFSRFERISHVSRFIFICNFFTDSPSYKNKWEWCLPPVFPKLSAEFVCSSWSKAIFCRRVALIVISVSNLILRPNAGGLGLQVQNKRRSSCNKRRARPQQNERWGALKISVLNVAVLQ